MQRTQNGTTPSFGGPVIESLAEALPESLARFVPGYDAEEREATPEGLAADRASVEEGSPVSEERAAVSDQSSRTAERPFKWLFWVLVCALLLYAMLALASPDPAFAQAGGGGGGNIQGAIDNARNWLKTIMTSLGGLGMIASIAVKAVARTNENMHHAAHMGMTGSGIAILGGLLVNDIIDLISGWAGGGG